jgi:hypothetical protein
MSGDFAKQLDAAAGPLKRLSAITAQVSQSVIPADAGCCCLCSVYEPHECEGWRAQGLVRLVPAAKVLGWQPPPVEVPTCRSCADRPIRRV